MVAAARPGAERPLAGIVWTVVAAASFAGLAGTVRVLGARLPAVEIVFFRALLGVALVAPFVLARRRVRLPAPKVAALHATRAAVEMVALSAWIGGIAVLPLGTAIALAFTAPLFTAVAGIVLFGERFRWRMVAGLGLGFAGVVVLARPQEAPLVPGVALMLLAALAIASSRTLIKSLTRRADTSEIVLAMMIFLVPMSGLAALPVWVAPGGADLALLALAAALATLAQAAMAISYRAAAFGTVAPFDYTQLIFALVLGWALFAEVPNGPMLAGAALIVAGALASRLR